MELEENLNVETEVTEVTPVEEPVETPETVEEEVSTETEVIEAEEEPISTDSIEATEPSQEEYTATKEEDKEESEEKEEESAEEIEDSEDEVVEEENDYSLLEEKYNALEAKYAEMEKENQELRAFKEAIDDKEKDALIDKFYMLSDEDKKEVIENKAQYSLDEIEAKLSVICVRKKVNFDSDDTSKIEENKKEESPVSYSLNASNDSTFTPQWLSALRHTRDNDNK